MLLHACCAVHEVTMEVDPRRQAALATALPVVIVELAVLGVFVMEMEWVGSSTILRRSEDKEKIDR